MGLYVKSARPKSTLLMRSVSYLLWGCMLRIRLQHSHVRVGELVPVELCVKAGEGMDD